MHVKKIPCPNHDIHFNWHGCYFEVSQLNLRDVLVHNIKIVVDHVRNTDPSCYASFAFG